MGFFDILAPLFLSFDEFVSPFLSPLFRVVLWGLLSAIISNLIFKWLSNPVRISSLKTQLKSMQKQLNQHDGEFSEFKKLSIDTVKVSIKRMGLTFIPAMLASLPIIFVLTYLSNNYGLVTPKASENIKFQVSWSDVNKPFSLSLSSNTISFEKELELIKWPSNNQVVSLIEGDSLKIIDFPMTPSPIVHKKQWWNSLIGNPAGYLPEESQIKHILFEFRNLELINFGPDWMRGWLFIFFSMTVIFSIVFIVLFKIKF